MSKADLTPLPRCPFCGHKPFDDDQTARIMGRRVSRTFAVACTNCEAIAAGADTLPEALLNWSTRAAPIVSDTLPLAYRPMTYREMTVGQLSVEFEKWWYVTRAPEGPGGPGKLAQRAASEQMELISAWMARREMEQDAQ